MLYADATPTCTILPGGDPTFCDPNNSNSTGAPARLSSSIVTPADPALTDLHLDVSSGPPGEFGYFMVAQNNAMPIALGNGLFCLSTTASLMARYNVGGTNLDSIGMFDANGDLVNLVGNSSVPGGLGFDVPINLPAPLPMIMAGSTWHFQVWFRDTPAGPGQSNLSNGLSHTF